MLVKYKQRIYLNSKCLKYLFRGNIYVQEYKYDKTLIANDTFR